VRKKIKQAPDVPVPPVKCLYARIIKILSPCGRGIKGEGEIHLSFPYIKK